MTCRHSGRHVCVCTWMCVCCATISCALRWGVTLVGNFHYWALFTPLWDPFSGTGPVQTTDPHMGPHMG